MPEQLIATMGAWYVAACALALVAVFVEQAGAARSPEEEGHAPRAATLMLMLASLLTPGLLLLHGFFLTAAETQMRLVVMAAPIGAILAGALLGAIVSAIARSAAPTMRRLALPLGLAALALTLYATSPSVVALANGLQDGLLELPVRPV